jgi:NADPH:quinone reductase
MMAITIPRFGGPEVLEPADLPVPTPGPGEVAIDVANAGANFAEVIYRRGAVDVELPFVPGIEVSGRIRELGDGVRELRVGQPVAALTIVASGGYSEIAVTDARLVAALPEDIGDQQLGQMAGVPSNTTTALVIFAEIARLRDGERVLVHGAAGGVGSQVGQAAKLLGASHIVGTVGRAAKVDAARGFGYDEVILRDDLDKALAESGGFDVIVDPVGGATRRKSLDALALGGRLIAMGNASGADDVQVAANGLWFASTGVLGFNLAALSAGRPELVGDALQRAIGLVLDARIHVEVSDHLPLREAAQAHERIESGATTGKLVLDVASH